MIRKLRIAFADLSTPISHKDALSHLQGHHLDLITEGLQLLAGDRSKLTIDFSQCKDDAPIVAHFEPGIYRSVINTK